MQNVTVIEQEIEVTYSYWDGSGHRRNTVVTKGTTIAQFLDSIRTEFKEIRNVCSVLVCLLMLKASVDSLMFIKEDLIIPRMLLSVILFTKQTTSRFTI